MTGCRRLLAVLALAAGCASPQAEQAEQARTALVGLPRSELLACAGVPHRSRSDGATEYWTYGSEQLTSQPGPGFGLGVGMGVFGGSGGIGYGVGVPLYGEVSSTYCEATFVLEQDRVTRVNYVGVAGYGRSRYAQCAYIVQSCLAAQQIRAAMQGGAAPGPAGTPVPAGAGTGAASPATRATP